MMAATSSGKAVVTLPTDTQILITRDFAAPKHKVYKAWTTPELIKRWWAGKRGVMKAVDVDLRVGGTWRYVMETNRGFEIAFHGEYREIVPNERIVTTEVFEMPDPPPGEPPLNIVSFTEMSGGTRLTLLTQTGSKELRDMIINSGMEGGMQEHMDLLEEVAISLR